MSASEGLATRQAGFKCSDAAITAYKFVTLGTSTVNETVVKQAGAGEKLLGITYESTAAANRTVGVNVEAAVCPLMVDGNAAGISAGDRLKSDASGKGVPVASDFDEYGALALAASTADGDVIPVMIVKGIYGV